VAGRGFSRVYCGPYCVQRSYIAREIAFELENVSYAAAQLNLGIVVIAARFFSDLVVHFYRNVFSHFPHPTMREVAAMPKAIHAAEDVAAAREKARQVITKLRDQRLTRAAELVEKSIDETLATTPPGGTLAAHSDEQSAGTHFAGDPSARAWLVHSRMDSRP
jgi:Transposase, Mutator family